MIKQMITNTTLINMLKQLQKVETLKTLFQFFMCEYIQFAVYGNGVHESFKKKDIFPNKCFLPDKISYKVINVIKKSPEPSSIYLHVSCSPKVDHLGYHKVP